MCDVWMWCAYMHVCTQVREHTCWNFCDLRYSIYFTRLTAWIFLLLLIRFKLHLCRPLIIDSPLNSYWFKKCREASSNHNLSSPINSMKSLKFSTSLVLFVLAIVHAHEDSSKPVSNIRTVAADDTSRHDRQLSMWSSFLSKYSMCWHTNVEVFAVIFANIDVE